MSNRADVVLEALLEGPATIPELFYRLKKGEYEAQPFTRTVIHGLLTRLREAMYVHVEDHARPYRYSVTPAGFAYLGRELPEEAVA